MILKNKNGSHVGMMLSFVIFITFIVFLYTVVNPAISNTDSKKTLLEEIGLKIISNMSSNFTSLSININSGDNPSTNCIQLEKILYYAEIIPYLIVKNEAQNEQNAYYDPATDFNDIRIDRASTSNLFFKVYYSPEFEKLPETIIPSCSIVYYGTEYEIGSVNSGKYVFEKNIYLLVDYYNADYEKLKNELKISPGNEFGFEFTFSDGTKIAAMEEIESSNIYAEEIPVQYIDDNANILSGFINIKVW